MVYMQHLLASVTCFPQQNGRSQHSFIIYTSSSAHSDVIRQESLVTRKSLLTVTYFQFTALNGDLTLNHMFARRYDYTGMSFHSKSLLTVTKFLFTAFGDLHNHLFTRLCLYISISYHSKSLLIFFLWFFDHTVTSLLYCTSILHLATHGQTCPVELQHQCCQMEAMLIPGPCWSLGVISPRLCRSGKS